MCIKSKYVSLVKLAENLPRLVHLIHLNAFAGFLERLKVKYRHALTRYDPNRLLSVAEHVYLLYRPREIRPHLQKIIKRCKRRFTVLIINFKYLLNTSVSKISCPISSLVS